MWAVSAPQEAWHVAISDLSNHTLRCHRCTQVDVYGRNPLNRCAEGQRFYTAEQDAYAAHVSDRYAGLAVSA